MTASGMEPATFRFVAQRLNHCATAVPITRTKQKKNSTYSITPLIRTLVIRIFIYPDWLGPSDKSVENSTKLTCPEITCYRIKYSAVLWLLELQIRA